ncbi:MAG: hypothetical protein RL033_2612 [Pseudomonadota bacterium]|jgi:hypothetical protein
MKKTNKSIVAALSGLAGMVLIAGSSFAIEPTDNNPPIGSLLFRGNATYYECGIAGNGCSFGTGDTISSTTDNDYILASCGQSKVNEVKITLQTSPFIGAKDLDIDVLKPNNVTIGTSHGVGQVESVNTSAANLSAVVLRVFGFNGGQNTYEVTVTCQ